MNPGLGVVDLGPGTRFVLADIPGLIEGAADGAGLGTRFLGHIERCKVLLHLIDGTSADVVADYQTIRGELEAYEAQLTDKPILLGLNKIDALNTDDIAEKSAALKAVSGQQPLHLSGVTGAGVDEVLRALTQHLNRHEPTEMPRTDEAWQP